MKNKWNLVYNNKKYLVKFPDPIRKKNKNVSYINNAFSEYVKGLLREKKITQQMVFLKADIPERYGYKLLSGEKHTRQRDVILRICYAAEMTLDETQRALQKYEMPQLYVKIPRDALLMIIFKDRPGGIIEVNELLREKGMDMLRTSGMQE